MFIHFKLCSVEACWSCCSREQSYSPCNMMFLLTRLKNNRDWVPTPATFLPGSSFRIAKVFCKESLSWFAFPLIVRWVLWVFESRERCISSHSSLTLISLFNIQCCSTYSYFYCRKVQDAWVRLQISRWCQLCILLISYRISFDY
jgi:hypothetical protein